MSVNSAVGSVFVFTTIATAAVVVAAAAFFRCNCANLEFVVSSMRKFGGVDIHEFRVVTNPIYRRTWIMILFPSFRLPVLLLLFFLVLLLLIFFDLWVGLTANWMPFDYIHFVCVHQWESKISNKRRLTQTQSKKINQNALRLFCEWTHQSSIDAHSNTWRWRYFVAYFNPFIPLIYCSVDSFFIRFLISEVLTKNVILIH